MKLLLKVVPGSSQTVISGWLDDSLKVRVTAPAEGGKANTAVIALLAETLGIPGTSIKIVSGSSKPRKIIEIDGLTEMEVRQRLKAII